MAETQETNDSTEQENRVAVVPVPAEHAERVRDFARSLQRQDAEVSGYSTPGTASLAGGSPIGAGPIAGIGLGTDCGPTGPRIKPTDWECTDYYA
jgi:hypothetical protein